jgi:GNAT superfamily N-acetyltransferase
MKDIEIRRPKLEDMQELYRFFRVVITDTYQKEGIADLKDDMEAEIASKEKNLQCDLNCNGEHHYFLIAVKDGKIIGSIEIAPANEMIIRCTKGVLKNHIEVGTVFVHPDYQRQGVGNQLLQATLQTLKTRGVREFCLDSGYKAAQKIWTKKFGHPEFWLKDYWGSGSDYMIWRVKL